MNDKSRGKVNDKGRSKVRGKVNDKSRGKVRDGTASARYHQPNEHFHEINAFREQSLHVPLPHPHPPNYPTRLSRSPFSKGRHYMLRCWRRTTLRPGHASSPSPSSWTPLRQSLTSSTSQSRTRPIQAAST